MSLSQVQLVKWSLPAFALILGLLWYKRRRVDRVDPGGAVTSKKLEADNADVIVVANGCTPKETKTSNHLYDSGIHTDDSFSVNNTVSSTPIEENISPRRVSESLDIPTRKSSGPHSIRSCKSIELNNTLWYDETDNTPEMQEIQLGSNPSKNGFEYMSKSKSSSGGKNHNNNNTNIMENVIEEEAMQAKIIVANGTDPVKVNNSFKECVKQEPERRIEVDEQNQTPEEKAQRQALSERDSANHSPVSGVLEGSVTDEARSEGSTDSGKGGSINGHHSKDSNKVCYTFEIPVRLVGKLIGRGGRSLANTRSIANVNITVKRHPMNREFKICIIEGSPDGITTALELIREQFPLKLYPQLTFEQFILEPTPIQEIPLIPQLIQLSLIENVNNDVMISHYVQPEHLFIHLPTHPSYPALRVLDEKMTQWYETYDAPPVPDVLSQGMIIVVRWVTAVDTRWTRACVEEPQGDMTLVRLVDYGGFWKFRNCDMRKIRADYLELPFQAIEVFLANIRPKDGEPWKQEAMDLVGQFSTGIVGQAQIVGYVDNSTFINLFYTIPKHGVISVADELVARGLADPVDDFAQQVLQTQTV